MSLQVWNVRLHCGVVILAAGVGGGGALRAADGAHQPGRPIEFSTPKSELLVTNLSQLEPGGDKQDLKPAIPSTSSLAPSGGALFDLTLPPSHAMPVPSRRLRESPDDSHDWATAASQEMMRSIVLQSILKSPGQESEGKKTKTSSSVDWLYQRVLHGKAGTDYDWQSLDLFGSARRGGGRRGTSPGDTRDLFSGEAGRSGRSVDDIPDFDLDSPFSPPSAKPNNLGDMFGPDPSYSSYEMSPEGIRAKQLQETQIKRFQDLLDGLYNPPAPPATASPTLSGPAGNPWWSARPLPISGPEQRNPYVTLPGATIDPALLPPKPPTAPVPLSLSPAPYTPPQINSMLTPPADFTVPHRPF